MKNIPFTEFVLPNGRMQVTPVPYPEDMEQVYQELQKEGCRFQMEWLRTGHCSLTVDRGYDFADSPIGFEICKQITPEVVTRLLLDAQNALSQAPHQTAALF